MDWYFFLNYHLYKYYQRKKSAAPLAQTFWLTTALFTVNFLSIIGAVVWLQETRLSALIDIPGISVKYYALPIIVFFALINYLLAYANKKHEDIFWEIEQNYKRYAPYKKSVQWYVAGSIGFFFAILILVDVQNRPETWSFLF